MFKFLFKYLFVFFINFHFYGQAILPFIENYTKQDYKGDNQIWGLTQGQDHAMYFANNRFLLRYNGVEWEKFTLPNQTIIRSVFSYQDKIYTGSFNEFGFWKREKGIMKYHSLVPDHFFKETDSEEVWKIFKWKDKLYFQTFSEMYVYDFKYIKRVKFPKNISYCFVIENDFLVATVEEGIFSWDEKHFIPIKKWEPIKGKIVHSIEKIKDKYFIFTQKSGVYVEENNELKIWTHPINSRLKTEIINATEIIGKDRIAIGTSSNGLYIIDLENNLFQNINKNASLQNNSVLSIGLDNEKDIWLALDNGIAHIESNSPYLYFTDKSGQLGSVYAIAPTERGYLLGSNHGLFLFENNHLTFVNNSQGQIWNIFYQNNEYIIGHNDGTFLYRNGTLEKKNLINGGWAFKKNKFNKGYIQSNYTGIAFYDDINKLEHGIRLKDFNAPIRDFVQLSENEIIVAHNNKGLFYIKYNQEPAIEIMENITQNSNIKADYGVRILEFKKEHLFYIDKHWYYYDRIDARLKVHDLFEKNINEINEVISIDESNFAVVKNDILFIINKLKDNFNWRGISNKLYSGRLINREIKIIKEKNQFVLTIDDGFLILKNSENKKSDQKITVEGYYNNEIIMNQKIPHNKTVELNIISEFFGNNRINLFYSVNENPILPLSSNKLILNNLVSGNYHVRFFENIGSTYKEIYKYSFVVKLPWYFSIWMIFLYLLIFGIVLLMYYRWNKVRFIEKLKLKEEEMKHENKLKQMELEAQNILKIQEYEKHILENQVQLKANELAGKSLSLAKQTELIESIQDILEKEQNLQSLKTQINKAIKVNRLNKNEWKSFENNLLKSNEEFVKNLTHKYPNITSKDIKLCIYLKMNLSSKEIAPLMNISYRGVELHRYRLRKKLLLEQDENLNSFMSNL